jgi:hypothetical protein
MSRYEENYAEIAERDFARKIYEQCDAEDLAASGLQDWPQTVRGITEAVAPNCAAWLKEQGCPIFAESTPPRTCEAMIPLPGDLTGEGAETCGRVIEPGEEFCEGCRNNS